MTRETSMPRYSPRGPSHFAMCRRAAQVPDGRGGGGLNRPATPPAPTSILGATSAAVAAAAADGARAEVV